MNVMEEKKVICNSGGVFHKREDGCLLYRGGNADVIYIDNQMTFDKFEIELAKIFGRSSSIGATTMSIKYLIPGHSKTLITISNDKDLRNMIKIHRVSVVIELYVMTDEMLLPLDGVSNMQNCFRRTTLAPANAMDDTNATLKLIAPVNGFGDANNYGDFLSPYFYDMIIEEEGHRQTPLFDEMIIVEEEHGQTPLLCEMIIEQNPGSLATFTTKDDSTFPGRFFAFRASLLGFQKGCRPLLFLDSMSLSLPSNVLLLTARTIDGDDKDLPIAFGVVDRETGNNWCHFLLQLKACLSISCPITFVARRGLTESISNVFPGSFHAFCVEYLIAELFEELKTPISSYVKNQIESCCNYACLLPCPKGFHEDLERIKDISSEAYNWISKIEPKNWTNAFFPGERYNCVGAYSPAFRFGIREACEEVSSVTQLVDALGLWTMELIIERRRASTQWMSRLTPFMEKMLEREKLEAGCFEVLRSEGSRYEVGGVSNKEVDIDKRNCSCRWWQIDGTPCSHALAVIRSIDGNPSDYCSRYFTTENHRITYSFD